MTASPILLTGFGSVTVLGPRRGLLAASRVEPQLVERWPTRRPRRARLVAPFRPGEVVPGLKTRRFDRLSVWALVAASLALDDARFDPRSQGDCDRFGVTFGTAFGCLDQTEEFMRSIARSGHAMADPILFPETLSNLPASHAARHFAMHGPNATLSAGALSAEAALLEAVGAIRAGEADLAVVMAGDELSQALFEWYDAAGLLPSATAGAGDTNHPARQFIPGEGLGAVVVETAEHAAARGATPYARLRALTMRDGSGGEVESIDDENGGPAIGRGFSRLAPTDVRLVLPLRDNARAGGGDEPTWLGGQGAAPTSCEALDETMGEFWSSGIVGLALALGSLRTPARGLVLTASTEPGGGRSTVALEVHEDSRR